MAERLPRAALLCSLLGFVGLAAGVPCPYTRLESLLGWLSVLVLLVLPGLALSIVALALSRGQRLSGWAALVANLSLILVHPGQRSCIAYAESTAINDIRALVAAQSAYARLSGGHYDTLECLAKPSECVSGYPETGPVLDRVLLVSERQGYKRSFHPGPRVKGTSASAIESWAYTAYPVELARTGNRAFCGDSAGTVCFTIGGEPAPVSLGRCVIGEESPCREMK